jgi:hypothetical protein
MSVRDFQIRRFKFICLDKGNHKEATLFATDGTNVVKDSRIPLQCNRCPREIVLTHSLIQSAMSALTKADIWRVDISLLQGQLKNDEVSK